MTRRGVGRGEGSYVKSSAGPQCYDSLVCEAGASVRIDFYDPDDCCWDDCDAQDSPEAFFADEAELLDDMPISQETLIQEPATDETERTDQAQARDNTKAEGVAESTAGPAR